MLPGGRKRYKAWIFDPDAKIPKTTSWRKKRNRDFLAVEHIDDNELPATGSAAASEDAESYDEGNGEERDIDTDTDTDADSNNEGVGEGEIDINAESNNEGDGEGEINNDAESNNEGDGEINNDAESNNEGDGEIDNDAESNNEGDGEIDNDAESNNEGDGEGEIDTDAESNNEGNGEGGDIETDDVLRSQLYENSNLTLGSTLYNVLDLFFKNAVTKTCLQDILQYSSKILPANKLPKTLYAFDKVLASISPQVYEKHYYCHLCDIHLGTHSDDKNIPKCTNEDCQIEGSKYFYIFPLKDILPLTLKNVSKYFIQRGSRGDVVSDIISGSEYKKLTSDCNNEISLLLNTDGVQLFKSSNESHFWPIQCHILQLSPLVRYKVTVVLAAWINDKKPDMNCYLKPLIDQFRDLKEHGGLSWTDHLGVARKSNIVCPALTADAPAKAAVLNIQQHNGEYGCSICEVQGTSVPSGRGRCMSFPYPPNDCLLRTAENMEMQGEIAYNRKLEHVKGVKGPTVLSLMPNFDVAKSCVIDYMHSTLLGTVRSFLNIWFNPTFHEEEWYIGRHERTVSEIITAIKTPYFITRKARPISTRGKWKAHELRAWLLWYSLPALKGLLPRKFFDHWCLLVFAIFSLLREDIPENDIREAERCLQMFVALTPDLYPAFMCTYNLHQLVHLASNVRQWGALWTHSAFSFESANGLLTRIIHGRHQVQEELIKTLNYYMAYKTLSCFSENQSSGGNDIKLSWPLALELDITFKNVIEHDIGCDLDSERPKIYSKMKVGYNVFTSRKYVHSKTKNSQCVEIESEDVPKYAIVEFFVELSTAVICVCNTLKVLRRNYFCNGDADIRVTHLIPVAETHEFRAFNIERLKDVFISINSTRNEMYLGRRPNFIEYNL